MMLREITAGNLKATNVTGKGLSHFHLGFAHCSEHSKAMEFHIFLAHLPTWFKRPSKDLTLPLRGLLFVDSLLFGLFANNPRKAV